ncbi:unnamed protein product [Durusdinium trenchii]|uniref:Peptidase A1 domain-containing protein n=1 Tax=Durusdinium trenchii TaxID=1381693 RepID=A0ABP0HA87_9DINO
MEPCLTCAAGQEKVVEFPLQRHRLARNASKRAQGWSVSGFPHCFAIVFASNPWGWSIGSIPWLPKPRVHKVSVERTVSAQLQDLQDIQYIGRTSIGSPKQDFRMILDTGSSDLWVSAERYSRGLSDTWQLVSKQPVELEYGQGLVRGLLGVDRACLLTQPQPLCVNQEFLVASSVQDLDLSTFDGLLGLGLPGLSHVRQDFLQSLVKAGFGNGHLCFSFSLKREADASFAVFGPCSEILRRAAEETGLPPGRAPHFWVQQLFGTSQTGWWLISVGISCNGTRFWQGPDMLAIGMCEISALMLFFAFFQQSRLRELPWKPSSSIGRCQKCLRACCQFTWDMCQALMLIFVLTCAFVIIVTVAIDTFRSEVIAALDTGTSFIVIPKDDFAQASTAMFGSRLKESCVVQRSELLCACAIAAEASPLDVHTDGVLIRLEPQHMFEVVDNELVNGDQQAAQHGSRACD